MTEINVKDLVSGSALHITSSNLGGITGRSYSAKAYGFGTNSTGINQEHLPQVVINPSIETSNSSSDVTIKTTETSKFTPGTRPITKFFNYEKSMYQVISDRMLEFMAGIEGFNDMIGAPVNKYRQDYKSLDKMRQAFFDRVENDLDLDKFIEYYRWIDGSVSSFLNQLAPATANMSSKLRNTVDSHLLERNKYKHQAPTIEFKFNEDTHSIFGINESLYNWRLGHAIPDTMEKLNAFAIELDGTNDHVLISDHNDFSFTDGSSDKPFSISAWVYVGDISADNGPFVSKINFLVSTRTEYLFKHANGTLEMFMYDTAKSASGHAIKAIANAASITNNTWHHVVMTYDGSGAHTGITLYTDGAATTSTNSETGAGGYDKMTNTSTPLVLGATQDGAANSTAARVFEDRLADVCIFNKRLSASEVTEIYNSGKVKNLADSSVYNDLVSWWKMGDDRDTAASGIRDYKSTHHGTLENGASIVKLEEGDLPTDIIRAPIENNCLYQNERAPTGEDRATIRRAITTEVSGSTYARRALVKPYRLASDYSPATIEKRDSAKESYKLVDTDSTKMTLSSDDLIRERDYCKTISTDTFDDGKYEYDAKILVGGESQNSKALLPISFNSSSVVDQIQELKPGLEVTNLPENQDRFILQGPFTRQHVGSMPHRRQAITLDKMNRHEAYNIEVNPSSLTMSAVPIGDPSSRFARGIGVSSPYTVENIRFSTASNFLGNYQQPYEIVQTNGRNSANVQFVKDGGITDIVNNSLFLSGTPDFANVNRGTNKHVVSNRFASPGGPETSPALTGDRETGELSIYNTLNYRNLFPVRTVQNSLLSQKSEQFGVVSSSLGPKSGGSTHKTQRNTRFKTEILTSDGTPILTASFDNAYVTKPIPQNAFQYSWISGNLSGSAANFINTNDGYGYVHSFYNSSGPGEEVLKLNLKSPERLEEEHVINDSCLGFRNDTGLSKTSNIKTSTNVKNFSFHNSSGATRDMPFSLSCNIRFLKDTNSTFHPVFYVLGTNSSGYRFSVSNTGIEFLLLGPSGTAHVYFTKNFNTELELGRFYNITLVYDAFQAPSMNELSVDVYVDGIYQSSNSLDIANSATPYLSSTSHMQSDVASTIYVGSHGAGQDVKNVDLYDLYVISGSMLSSEVKEVFQYSKSLRLNKTYPEETGFSSSIDSNTFDILPGKAFPNNYHPQTEVNNISDISILSDIVAYYQFSGSFPLAGGNTIGAQASSFGAAPEFSDGAGDEYLATSGLKRHVAANANKFYKRNGTFTDLLPHYSWASWNQVRGSEHPVSIKDRKANTLSVVVRSDVPNVSSINGYNWDANSNESIINDNIITSDREVRNYIEPAAAPDNAPVSITFHGQEKIQKNLLAKFSEEVNSDGGNGRYNPLDVASKLESQGFLNTQEEMEKIWSTDLSALEFSGDSTPVPALVAKITYQNDLGHFANNELKSLLKINVNASKMNDIVSNLFPEPFELSYTETIFPRKATVGLNRTRTREKFDFANWKKNLSARAQTQSGSLGYRMENFSYSENTLLFPSSSIAKDLDPNLRNSMGIDAISFVSSSTSQNYKHIASSRWPLDAHTGYESSISVRNIRSLGPKDTFGSLSTPGQLGEGELMNDYSIFHNQENNLHISPPPAMVYSRRVVQTVTETTPVTGVDDLFLAGTTPWLAAEQLGSYPYPDSHEEKMSQIRPLSQGFSIIPEFRISEFVEEVVNERQSDFSSIGKTSTESNYLSLTGSTLERSSSDFYKIYSTTDFMEFFQVIREENSNILEPLKLTLRCDAALNFVPYEGFYPAERAVQIGRIFSNNYMKSGRYEVLEDRATHIDNKKAAIVKKKIANMQQSIKPLFAPGVLFNSIKSGLAVDYPIFVRKHGPVTASYNASTNPSGLLGNGTKLNGSPYTLGAGRLSSNAGKNEVVFQSGVTGSFFNITQDPGIPRLTGSVYRRVSFEDLLDPSRMEGINIYDNEPHPSASLVYGNSFWEELIDRPFKFGEFDKKKTAVQTGVLVHSQPNLREDLKTYRMAINNFCAEATNFFVEDSFTTLETRGPAFDANRFFKAGHSYEMEVSLRNNDVMMYDRHSAFGPPVDENHSKFLTTSSVEYTVDGQQASTTIAFYPTDTNGLGSVKSGALGSGSLPGFKLRFSPDADPDNICKTIEFVYLDTSNYYFGFSSGSSHEVLTASTSHNFSNNTATESRRVYIDTAGSDANAVLYRDATAKALQQLVDNNHAAFTVSSKNQFVTDTVEQEIGYSQVATLAVQFGTAGTFGNLSIEPIRNLPASIATAQDFFWGNLGFNYDSGELAEHALENYSLMSSNKTTRGTFEGGSNPEVFFSAGSAELPRSGSHGYLPFVPPFLDPGTSPKMKIVFEPNESREYTLDEVLQSLQFTSSLFPDEYSNDKFLNTDYIGKYEQHGGAANHTGDTNFTHAMTLSSSIDFAGWSLYAEDFDSLNNSNATRKESTRWVIQTKWETPVLDFKKSTAKTVDLLTKGTVEVDRSFWKERNQLEYYSADGLSQPEGVLYMTASRGMWHQGGKVPGINADSSQNGYTLEISNVDGLPAARQLAIKAGFLAGTETKVSKPVGKLKKKKNISEAVVAVPFYVNTRNRKKYFTIKTSILNKAKNHNRRLKRLSNQDSYEEYFNNPGQTPVETSAYQMRMMEKYIFPPEFDFLKFDNGTANFPSMFVFQFNAALTQNDLSNIWQNVMPSSAESAANGKISVSTDSNERFTSSGEAGESIPVDTRYATTYLDIRQNSNLQTSINRYGKFYDFLDKDVQWIVFKVKLRASNSVAHEKEVSLPGIKNGDLVSSYFSKNDDFDDYLNTVSKGSYNWPYDYFSLVELVKIKAKADFTTKNLQQLVQGDD